MSLSEERDKYAQRYLSDIWQIVAQRIYEPLRLTKNDVHPVGM